MHVFGWWEEAGELVPVENPRIHGENMQTPHRKAPAGNRTWNSCCEATVLTTTPPYTVPQIKICRIKDLKKKKWKMHHQLTVNSIILDFC